MRSNHKIAFLGAGVIAEVWVERLLASKAILPDRIMTCDPRAEQLARLGARWGIRTAAANVAGAEFADLVVLATPPAATLPVVREVRPALTAGKVLLSVAAAVQLDALEGAAGIPAVRVMPNTPSLLGEGMNLVAFGQGVTKEHKDDVIRLLDIMGRWFEVPDREMNRWCALCAAGPTYFLPIIAALAEAATASGLPLSLAMQATGQVAAGAARLVQQGERTPEQLKQMISLRTLHEDRAAPLFADAYRAALQKLEALQGKIDAEQAAALPTR